MQGVRIRDNNKGQGSGLSFGLKEILEVIGERVVESTWKCREVDYVAKPENALHETNKNKLIDAFGNLVNEYNLKKHEMSGKYLQEFAGKVMLIINGEFLGYYQGAKRPWIIIKAFDSSWWEVFSKKPEYVSRFKEVFKDVKDVQIDL